MLKKFAATGVLAAALLLGAPAAGAMAYVPTPVGGSSTVAPGGSLTLAYEGFAANSQVLFTVAGPTSVTLAVDTTTTKTTNAQGEVELAVTIPSTAAAGSTYTVTANGSGAEQSLTQTATITVAAADADAGGLPVTGAADTGAIVWFGLGALALGAAAVSVVAVKRRQTV
ncbi:MAG TPA: LPXTG cell wall anchor domain-containing protein [Microcella sp.]|nr:LPXTG cell wall anchor domain-containing protein [Microcella sp.]